MLPLFLILWVIAPPGLIVIGVAVNEDRAITGADFGYLILLFIALYIIRGIVILTAYPVLRSVSLVLNSLFVFCNRVPTVP